MLQPFSQRFILHEERTLGNGIVPARFRQSCDLLDIRLRIVVRIAFKVSSKPVFSVPEQFLVLGQSPCHLLAVIVGIDHSLDHCDHGFLHHSPSDEFLRQCDSLSHQMVIREQDVVICPVFPDNAVRIPLPQVERCTDGTDPFRFTDGLSHHAEEHIFMDRKLLMKPDTVIHKVLPSVSFAVDEYPIPFMWNQYDGTFRILRFLREATPQGIVLVFVHSAEDQVQSEDA